MPILYLQYYLTSACIEKKCETFCRCISFIDTLPNLLCACFAPFDYYITLYWQHVWDGTLVTVGVEWYVLSMVTVLEHVNLAETAAVLVRAVLHVNIY